MTRVRLTPEKQHRGGDRKDCQSLGWREAAEEPTGGGQGTGPLTHEGREEAFHGCAGSPCSVGSAGQGPGCPGGIHLARRKAGSWPWRRVGGHRLMFQQPATPPPTDVPASCQA